MVKQQGQLHMNMDAQGKNEEHQEEAHQILNVALLQGGSLPDNRAYLDVNGCSTVTAFKAKQYLKNVRTVPGGIKINYNAGGVSTNQIGRYGRMKVWFLSARHSQHQIDA